VITQYGWASLSIYTLDGDFRAVDCVQIGTMAGSTVFIIYLFTPWHKDNVGKKAEEMKEHLTQQAVAILVTPRGAPLTRSTPRNESPRNVASRNVNKAIPTSTIASAASPKGGLSARGVNASPAGTPRTSNKATVPALKIDRL
jgi:hypothetical protein